MRHPVDQYDYSVTGRTTRLSTGLDTGRIIGLSVGVSDVGRAHDAGRAF